MTLKVFLGFDPRETVVASVLAHSIQWRARRPVAISWVALWQLDFQRQRDPLQSNDFSFSRWLVPSLMNWSPEPALFLDSDMLCLYDIGELFDLYDSQYAVQVVKHEYTPRQTVKYLNQPQTPYSRKNWSSVMLFNPMRCKALTPTYCEHASGLDLHQFRWLEGDHEIGGLPNCWNYLVGEDGQCQREEARLIHYTNGGPYFHDYRDCDYNEAWFRERDDMLRCDQRAA